jgi:acetylornithine/succinyldiaminopimelate/putrescine aminotransferase
LTAAPPPLGRGDLPPEIRVAPPGPRSRALDGELAALEPPETRPAGAIVWQEALGSNVLDVDGNRYLDMTAGFGVAAVGHRHPAVVAAVERQARRLVHGLADAQGHPPRLALARRLAGLAPWPDARVLFAVSGADAVELALKSAVLATGRAGIVAFEPSYHGLTLGALAATSRRSFREPFAAHLHPHVTRLPYGCEPARLHTALADGRTAAVIVEPVVGREGVLLPPRGWLAALRDLTAEQGTLLLVDEILTGFGRTGALFACLEEMGSPPDLLCCGKALGGGLPIAAVLGPAAVLSAWNDPGEARHTATFVAHPLACAAALAALTVLEREGLVERAATMGASIEVKVEQWVSISPFLRHIRGRGLLWGLTWTTADAARAFARACLARGVLVLAGGPDGRATQLSPPLVLTAEQLARACQEIERALAEIR